MKVTVTGCLLDGCPLPPDWLVPGFLTSPVGVRLTVHAQVCDEHLGLFGMRVNRDGEHLPPVEFMKGIPPPRVEFYFAGYPLRIRTVEEIKAEPVA